MRHDERLLLIGAVGGIVGMFVLALAPVDDLGPLDRALFWVVVAGGTMLVGLRGTGI